MTNMTNMTNMTSITTVTTQTTMTTQTKMTTLKIALCQMPVQTDKQTNLSTAADMVGEAATQGARLVVLPEMFNCPYSVQCFPDYAEEIPAGETANLLSALAKTHSIFLVGGSMPERDSDRIYNTSPVFDPQGKLIARHRKIHLFDVNIQNGMVFTESLVLSSGGAVTVFETPWSKIGLEICYDIRFPELSRKMAGDGARVIIVPAAFNLTTGPVHWELLFRSRAVDNQIFMLGASPARNPQAEYQAYGHSLAVDPWGNIIGQLDEKPGLLLAELDLARIDEVRAAIPVWKQRREDVY